MTNDRRHQVRVRGDDVRERAEMKESTTRAEVRSRKRLLNRIDRSCASKRQHLSKSEALIHAGNLRNNGQDVEVYECQFCGGWHVGHKKEEL